MVFRTQGLGSGELVHRSTPLSRWLRARRLRIAAWIAVAEGVLVLIHAVPRIPAMILVPVLAALIGGLAIIALVALAVVALFVLLQDRR